MSVFANPQIVRFCNQTIRPLADDVTRLAVAVQNVMVVVQAQGILATLQAADQTAVIDDGSATDGRPPINVGQLVAFLAECQKAQSAIDTTTAVAQAAAIQVNGNRMS
jgi:hypothetical protein